MKPLDPIAPPRGPVVYVLKRGGLIIYVGSSTSLAVRIRSHRSAAVSFDSVEYVAAKNRRDMLSIERALILAHRPAMNIQVPGGWPDSSASKAKIHVSLDKKIVDWIAGLGANRSGIINELLVRARNCGLATEPITT